jgi:hypothetical protein
VQFLAYQVDQSGKATEVGYYEAGPDLQLKPVADADEQIEFLNAKIPSLDKPRFHVDEASAWVEEGGHRWRLPKAHAVYDEPMAIGWPRDVREVVTERRLLNVHGTIYVFPHTTAGGMSSIKPVCTHNKRIIDFCSWRGMLVLAGACQAAEKDAHAIQSSDGKVGLWLGDVDDLWKLGKPRGYGGPWKDTSVKAGESSDPYLMTGYDKKTLTLSHDAKEPVGFTVEVDFVRTGKWCTYQEIEVPAGKSVTHEFPDGYSCHWARVTANRDCAATAQFLYE